MEYLSGYNYLISYDRVFSHNKKKPSNWNERVMRRQFENIKKEDS